MIKTGEPFESLFPIDAKVYASIYDDMEASGFDPAHPIIVWQERGVVVDGHTRLQAAQALGLSPKVIEKSFRDEDEAVEYAIHCQRDRRNVSDADLFRWVAELDKRKKAGRPKESATHVANLEPKRTSEETAAAIGTSRGKVEKARTVIDHAPEQVKQEVLSGEKSINKAYTEVIQARKEERKEEEKEVAQKAPQTPPEPVRQLPLVERPLAMGIQHAQNAIWQLEKIDKNDSQREEAFALVRAWIDKQAQSKKGSHNGSR